MDEKRVTGEPIIAVEELRFGDHEMVIRHHAPRFDTISLSDGEIHIARIGPLGYAVHEPLFGHKSGSSRADRRAARSKKAGRR